MEQFNNSVVETGNNAENIISAEKFDVLVELWGQETADEIVRQMNSPENVTITEHVVGSINAFSDVTTEVAKTLEKTSYPLLRLAANATEEGSRAFKAAALASVAVAAEAFKTSVSQVLPAVAYGTGKAISAFIKGFNDGTKMAV